MSITRRLCLKLTAAALDFGAWGLTACEAGAAPAARNDIAPLPGRDSRCYSIAAKVTPFGAPVYCRKGVGESYVRIEEHPSPDGCGIEIEFAAGSFPEQAHGVNKMGFIRESIVENKARRESAYIGFMTTSGEPKQNDLKLASERGAEAVLYSIGYGSITPRGVTGGTFRITLPSSYNWRDRELVAGHVRAQLDAHAAGERIPFEPGGGAPATFLYAVRKAIIAQNPLRADLVVFEGKYFELETEKHLDAETGADLARRGLARSSDRVFRLTGSLRSKKNGKHTRFHIWFEKGFEHEPPLLFEYPAASFLTLRFEATRFCGAAPLTLTSKSHGLHK
jgi:hypothetical protein